MDLVVRSEYRRRGIGAKLTEKMHAYFLSNGVKEVYATVNPNNSESISLLERMGYIHCIPCV